MSYESQLKKWAEVQFSKKIDDSCSVSFSPMNITYVAGCPTCDYDNVKYADTLLSVRDKDNILIHRKAYDFQNIPFQQILKEIIEA